MTVSEKQCFAVASRVFFLLACVCFMCCVCSLISAWQVCTQHKTTGIDSLHLYCRPHIESVQYIICLLVIKCSTEHFSFGQH